MNKLSKFLVSLLMMISVVVGVGCFPKVSSADFTFSYPATTIYVEFVNKQGKDFTKPLNLEAESINFIRTWGVYSSLNSSSLTVTRVSGKNNRFALHLPAVNYTALTNQEYYQSLANLKMTTPLPISSSMTNVSSTSFRSTKFEESSGLWTNSNFNATSFGGTRNGDDTWNITMQTFDNILGTPTNYFGMRLVSDRLKMFQALGLEGDIGKIQINGPQIKEIFEDETGASIPAPTGYVNDNYIDVTDQPQSYQMVNDSTLPKTYTDSGYIYTYKGWYKGAGNQSSIVTAHPPTIGFNAGLVDAQNEVHIVYNKRAIRIIDEEYIDTSSGTIESSWNNMGQTMADGDTFTQTPAATKTDSSGAIWEYQGWKLGSEPMNAMKTTPVSHVISGNTSIQYVYKKKHHTMIEKWVDQADGSTLVPMAGNPKNSSIDDNDNFTGSATATITDTGGGIWDFVGWENVTDAPGTVNPSSSPQVVNNIKGSKEIRYHYQARNTTATLDLNPTPQVTASGGNVSWSSRLTNTGTSTLNNLKLKATSNWAAGLSAPTQVTVTPAGGSPQNFTVSPGDWTSGFNLTGINIPNAGPNNYADITFTDTATGSVNQVLPAEIEIDGNMASPLTAENFVRIDDPDEPNLEPSGNAGLINIPDFRFGDVEVKPFAQTKGLDTTAYQSGYNPYIRFMDNESTGGWSLTAKLGQFTSGSKTLPTTTAIKLKNGVLMEVQNYNKSNENLNYVDLAGSVNIPSDGTTVALTNKSNQGVYQLEYDINTGVELELMAHSGIAGLSYTADMDWTLTTAP